MLTIIKLIISFFTTVSFLYHISMAKKIYKSHTNEKCLKAIPNKYLLCSVASQHYYKDYNANPNYDMGDSTRYHKIIQDIEEGNFDKQAAFESLTLQYSNRDISHLISHSNQANDDEIMSFNLADITSSDDEKSSDTVELESSDSKLSDNSGQSETDSENFESKSEEKSDDDF